LFRGCLFKRNNQVCLRQSETDIGGAVDFVVVVLPPQVDRFDTSLFMYCVERSVGCLWFLPALFPHLMFSTAAAKPWPCIPSLNTVITTVMNHRILNSFHRIDILFVLFDIMFLVLATLLCPALSSSVRADLPPLCP
jgi:hypothetical protein